MAERFVPRVRRIGVDTGGTFTDSVCWDEAEGVVASAKVPTSFEDPASSVTDSIDDLCRAGNRAVGGRVRLSRHDQGDQHRARALGPPRRLSDHAGVSRRARDRAPVAIRRSALRPERAGPPDRRPPGPLRDRRAPRLARFGGRARRRRAGARDRAGARRSGDRKRRGLPPACLREPGPRARREGAPAPGGPGSAGVALERDPLRSPRVRAQQHRDPQRVRDAGHERLSRAGSTTRCATGTRTRRCG